MVDVKNVRDFLAGSPFFSDMEEAYFDLLAGCGTLAHIPAGDFLLREGEAADSFFLIRSGDVAIESHAPGNGALTVSKVGAEGVAGFSWLFPPYRNAFDARAVTEVAVVRLDGKCLRGKVEQDHELGYQFMSRFAQIILQRMQATRRQMLDVYGTGPDTGGTGTAA